MKDKQIAELLEKYRSGELNRRSFMKRAAAAGLTASAAASLITNGASAAPGTTAKPGRLKAQDDPTTLVVLDNIQDGSWLYFDPAVIYEINPTAGFNLIYEALYHLPDGNNMTGFEALLAEDMPTVSDDGLTATIKVKQGVKFHNSGNVMTAADWVFSWKRLAAIQGNASFIYSDNIADVVATDDSTLTLTLTAPNAALVAILADLIFAVTDSKVIQEHGGIADGATAYASDGPLDPATQWLNEGNSAGTGPFRLTEWDITNEITLEAYADYWGDKPALSRVIFRNVKDANTQIQLIQSGEADIAFALDPDAADKVKADPTMQILEGPSLAFEYLALQNDPTIGGPLSNKSVRQAIAHAIDYDGIINGLCGGAAVRPATVVPLGLLGADEVESLKYTTDLTKAQKLYDAAGVGEQEVTLTWGSGINSPAGVSRDILAPKYQEDLQKINGLKIKLNPMDNTQRLADYRAGKLQFIMSDWSPDYPDVQTYAQPFGQTGSTATKRINFSDPAVDPLLDAGIKELDPDKRKQDYVDAQKLLIDDAAFLVIFQPNYRSPASIKVQGAQPHGIYILQLRYASKTA